MLLPLSLTLSHADLPCSFLSRLPHAVVSFSLPLSLYYFAFSALSQRVMLTLYNTESKSESLSSICANNDMLEPHTRQLTCMHIVHTHGNDQIKTMCFSSPAYVMS